MHMDIVHLYFTSKEVGSQRVRHLPSLAQIVVTEQAFRPDQIILCSLFFSSCHKRGWLKKAQGGTDALHSYLVLH